MLTTSSLGAAFFVLLYYLPIYFQAVKGISAVNSGIRNLALILGVTIFTVISGGTITALGWFTPFVIVGSVLATIGCGLIYTLDGTSGHQAWIGYQALTGLALGMCFQTPVMVSTETIHYLGSIIDAATGCASTLGSRRCADYNSDSDV